MTPPAWLRRAFALVSAVALAVAVGPVASADPGYLTSEPAMIALDPSAPGGSSVLPIVNSGETVDGVLFEGIPDGIGVMPGGAGTAEVFVSHEQSRVPFRNEADLEDASVTKLTLNTTTGGVLAAEVAIPSSDGFIRFCSSFMAGPNEGFGTYTFFANEESNDVIPVPPGAPYGPDPSVAPDRQAGYAVALNAETGEYAPIAGMGRHNHENSIVVPGGWDQIAVLSGDDTFNAPSSQLYLYLADTEEDLWADHGTLWAFQVTRTDGGRVAPRDPFNGANDYGDIQSGDDWQGRFIQVPRRIARGLTAERPQDALENWSNANNVFQFIRIEDTAYDVSEPNVVYLADTGEARALPSAETGRLFRAPSGTPGPYPNGRIFRMEFDPGNPRKVSSFSILLNADTGGPGLPSTAPMHQPDNMDTSANSLMVQEDSGQAPPSRVWRYDFASETWSVVASVLDQAHESSGIVDVSAWFGAGTWLLDVQGHGDNVDEDTTTVPGTKLKRESGQLLLMTIPGS